MCSEVAGSSEYPSISPAADPRTSIFNSTQKRFWVIGYPIRHSKSPLIHNTGYEATDLPHRFDLHEVQSLGPEIAPLLNDENFGGAAVTMPFKLPIMDFCQEVTPAGKLLGACNTVSPKWATSGHRYLLGDNTDWLGIRDVLLRGLKACHNQTENSTGLIVGAGGAARAAIYALGELGIHDIYVFNRTPSKVHDLQHDFAAYHVKLHVITSLDASSFFLGPPLFVVGTVPAKATRTNYDSVPNDGSLSLSSAAFSRPEGGSMLDMAYLPQRTPLIAMAERSAFSVGFGIDVLILQACAQFRLWTGVEPPVELLTKVTLARYEAEQTAAGLQ